jgi:hypothetical protein
MFLRDKWSISIAMAIALVAFVAAAEAQQQFEITDFFFAKVTTLSDSKELTILSSEVWGITMSNNENKALDNMTSYCVAVRKFVAGKQLKSTTYTKFMDRDGDYFIVETLGGETSQADWTFLQGTGKWTAIKGGGKAWFSARGKTQTPGTIQGRVTMTGKFEISK